MRSIVRQNIVEILRYIQPAYGYQIYKAYCDLFPKVTLRLIYYHLNKGLQLEEFKINKTEKTKGEYSWGSETEKTFYSLGEKAKPKGDKRIEDYLKNK